MVQYWINVTILDVQNVKTKLLQEVTYINVFLHDYW